MIIIDGSQGEGGGQILRTALGLAMVTGRALKMENVRAKREKPGLMRQHLTALRAAAEVCGAEVTGDELGSGEVTFVPGAVRAGNYTFKIGTAGSTTLVVQTVLPALLMAGEPSVLVLEGGTHNPFAPPFDFLAKAFLPLVSRMGPTVTATLERCGFYPAGGGRIRIEVTPAARMGPLELLETGELKGRAVRAMVAALPRSVGERELALAGRRLGWRDDELHVEELPPACGPGNIITAELAYEHVTEVVTGFGQRGRTAESVAEELVRDVRSYVTIGAPVGPCLADQLLIPLAVAGGGAFRTGPLTRHARTNIEVIRRFIDVPIDTAAAAGKTIVVRVGA